MVKAMRCRVRGRVQGVFFRDSTRRLAASLGLRGHAVNLADGSVEVVAGGDEAALEVLRNWLGRGPDMARVDSIECRWLEDPIEAADFSIG